MKKFIRENIQFNPVTYYAVLGNGVGYLMLNDFTDKAALEFKNAVNDIGSWSDKIADCGCEKQSMGGLVDEAVKIMGYFVPERNIHCIHKRP